MCSMLGGGRLRRRCGSARMSAAPHRPPRRTRGASLCNQFGSTNENKSENRTLRQRSQLGNQMYGIHRGKHNFKPDLGKCRTLRILILKSALMQRRTDRIMSFCTCAPRASQSRIGDPVGVAAVHPVAGLRRGRHEDGRLPLGGVGRRDGEEERPACSAEMGPKFYEPPLN